MSSMKELVTEVENTSIKAVNHDPVAEQQLWKLLGDASTNRTVMNDLGTMLQHDSAQLHQYHALPNIEVVYSTPDSRDPERHVVDIEFRKNSYSEFPDLEWMEK
jgi:hypothetical protein